MNTDKDFIPILATMFLLTDADYVKGDICVLRTWQDKEVIFKLGQPEKVHYKEWTGCFSLTQELN